jgi:predicted TIM-barrel fold metal-dependent hydrolase
VGRIDTHSHVVPPDYAHWLRGNGVAAGGLPIPAWDPQATLFVMDRHDIAAAVLSVSTPGVHLGDDADARAMARHVNDYAAQMTRDHPDRFGFFATLPLPDFDGALTELHRAFDTLGADGVVLLANHRGIYLGDPRFDPIFDELQRRAAVVFVHPSVLPGVEAIEGIPPFIADFLLDTTRAALNLARTGTLDRCPDARFILSHAGGIVPYAAYRIALAASGNGDVAEGLRLLHRYYFDIALSGTPTALPSLLAFTTPEHITFGSDWPYASDLVVAAMTRMYETFDLDVATRQQIDRGTAATLFPRFA